MKKKELGFQKENILVLSLPYEEVRGKRDVLKQEFSRIPEVQGATACSAVPIRGFTHNGYLPEGFQSPMMFHAVDVDEDWLEVFGISLASGRNFSRDFSTDQNAFLINECLAEQVGWENPVGKIIKRGGEHSVIGVVKDFHFATLYDEIAPLVITHLPYTNRYRNLALKITSADLAGTLRSIRNTWNNITASAPFEYYFLDEAFDTLYKSVQHFQNMFLAFSVLALSIALLGLYSLTAQSTQQRTKEIGIRKTLGASIPNLIGLFSKEFLILVLISNVIAFPIAYSAMHSLLQIFAYRIRIGWGVFAFVGTTTLLVTLLTVGWQSFRAAATNPTETLRYE